MEQRLTCSGDASGEASEARFQPETSTFSSDPVRRVEVIRQAFVLGAGLGKRLRPLTEELPKPLVPIFQKPLITFAFDHLIHDLGIERFLVNTHYQPQCFAPAIPGGAWRERPIEFFHEPVLLETAGGIANIAEALAPEPFIVYNGDTLTDLPLAPLVEEHFRAGNVVTLALRSEGGPLHIGFDHESRRVVDIRNMLETGTETQFLFTGHYVVEPKFLTWLERGVKRSVIPIFLDMIRRGEKLGGVIIDEGRWWDVGTRHAYIDLHRRLPQLKFPRFEIADRSWRDPVHSSAQVHETARLEGSTVIGAEARIGAGAVLQDTIVWPRAEIASQSTLSGCIVRAQKTVAGSLRGQDI